LGKLTSIGTGSPNLLLYSLITSGTPPPPPPPPPPSADVPTHVADVLAISETSGKKNWKATLFVKAHELNGATHTELDGATVHVSWSGGATGETTCLTVTGGTCYIQTGQIPNSQASITFKITNISLSGYVYQKSDNHDDPSDGSVLLNDDEVAASKPGGGSGGNPGKGKKPN
jgi:hypothetical protein